MNPISLFIRLFVGIFAVVSGQPAPQWTGSFSSSSDGYAPLGQIQSMSAGASPQMYPQGGYFQNPQGPQWAAHNAMMQQLHQRQNSMGQRPGPIDNNQGHPQGWQSHPQASSWSSSHSGPDGSWQQMGVSGSGGQHFHQSASPPGASGVSSSSSSSSWSGPGGKSGSRISGSMSHNVGGKVYRRTFQSRI